METVTSLVIAEFQTGAATLPLQLLLIFASAKILAEVFERLGIPGIVGEIGAGIVIGPSILLWIQPSEVLTTLSELGVMFLLFRVGLDVKASELFRIGLPATIIATLGVIVPFASGWALAALWGHSGIESIFLAASMVATSVGITAQVLASKGLLQQRASRLILAAAVIDDVLGLLILAIVSSVAKGRIDVGALVTTAIVAIGFTLIIATWGTRAMKAIIPRVDGNLRVAEAQFAIAVSLLFGLAVLAVYAGVAAIIGAFLAGMALAGHVSHHVHDLTNGVTELLVPFFLVGIGLHFNLEVFRDPGLILFAGLILVAAILSKLIGCGVGALTFGRAEALRVGIGMIPRGEVGMVVAQLGLSMAVISDNIFAVVVFMSVLTTVIAPPLLAWAYRGVVCATQEEGLRIG
jgi:Kef-type K+ transport system membrane component KefB